MRKICMLVAFWVLAGAGVLQAGNVIVIANKNVSVSSLKRVELQQIYLGKVINWPDGKRVTPVMLKGGAAHELFLKNYLGKMPSQFDTFWKQAIFTGTGRPPKALGADADIVQFVSGVEGAIGYIDAGSAQNNVKILDIK